MARWKNTNLFFLLKIFPEAIGELCTDGANIAGTCKLINDCQPIKDLLLRGNLNDAERNYLMNSDCGMANGSRTVCCPPPSKIKKRIGYALPTVRNCGRLTDNRIVGGEIAALDDYPWLARIQYNKCEYVMLRYVT